MELMNQLGTACHTLPFIFKCLNMPSGAKTHRESTVVAVHLVRDLYYFRGKASKIQH